MSLKRQNTSSPEPEDDSQPAKRQRPSWVDDFDTFKHPTTREQPRVDFASGQQGAFPGLDDDDDELIYGEPEDGLQYLRMVRSERQNVPHILIAKGERASSLTDEADDDYIKEDYHPDQAWIAAPREVLHEASQDVLDAQDYYYLALLDRFAQLQTRLRNPPPLSAIEALPSSQPISFPPDTAKARDTWRHIAITADPSPTQLACMDPESSLQLVGLLTEGLAGVVKSKVNSKIRRVGGWVWAALARCRDRGELSSEEVAEVRELGKKAVQLLVFTRKTQLPEVGGPGPVVSEAAINRDEGMEDEFEDLEKAKARIAGMLGRPDNLGDDEEVDSVGHEMEVGKQIDVVLDMIITVVGEVFGQRDLLEHREIWE